MIPTISARVSLTYFGNNGLRDRVLAKTSEQKKNQVWPLLAGIEPVVDQILRVADITSEQKRHKRIESAYSRFSALIIVFSSIA